MSFRPLRSSASQRRRDVPHFQHGIGFVLVTPEYAADEVFHLLSQAGEQVYTLGSVERVSRRVVFVEGGA